MTIQRRISKVLLQSLALQFTVRVRQISANFETAWRDERLLISLLPTEKTGFNKVYTRLIPRAKLCQMGNRKP